MMWSAPATDNILATSLADMGARLCDKHQDTVAWGQWGKIKSLESLRELVSTPSDWWDSDSKTSSSCHLITGLLGGIRLSVWSRSLLLPWKPSSKQQPSCRQTGLSYCETLNISTLLRPRACSVKCVHVRKAYSEMMHTWDARLQVSVDKTLDLLVAERSQCEHTDRLGALWLRLEVNKAALHWTQVINKRYFPP